MLEVSGHHLRMFDELFANGAFVGTSLERRYPWNLSGRSEGGNHESLLRTETVEERRVAHPEFAGDLGSRNARSVLEETAPRGGDNLLIRDFFRSSHGSAGEVA